MKDETGGPAFPSHGSMGEVAQEGMTLRDYFASQALAAGINGDLLLGAYSEEDAELIITNAAGLAYRIADAMIKKRDA